MAGIEKRGVIVADRGARFVGFRLLLVLFQRIHGFLQHFGMLHEVVFDDVFDLVLLVAGECLCRRHWRVQRHGCEQRCEKGGKSFHCHSL